MSDSIPNPLRSGEFTLSRGSYSGDVGSTDPNNQPVLTLEHNASADVTVIGFDDPFPKSALPHYAMFDIKNKDTLDLSLGGGRFSPFGPGIATVNLQHGARLTGDFSTDIDGNLQINGATGSRLVDYSGNMIAGAAIIHADITGHGSILVSGGGNIGGGLLELDGRVCPGETINVALGDVLLDQPARFLGTIDWQPVTPPATVTLEGVTADSYAIINDQLHLFQGTRDILDLNFAVQSGFPPPLVSQGSQGVILSNFTIHDAVPLPLHQT